MKNRVLISLILLAGLALSACGGGASRESTAAEPNQAQAAVSNESIDVVMNDIYYGDSNDNATNPPTWTVTSEARVSVNMDNKGVLEHNWAVVKMGEQVSAVYDEATDQAKLFFDAGVLTGGNNQVVDFTAPLPGEYQVVCTVPGHSQAMQGKLVVQ